MSNALVILGTLTVVIGGALVVFFYWRSQYGAWKDTPGGLRGGRHDRDRSRQSRRDGGHAGGGEGGVTVVGWTTDASEAGRGFGSSGDHGASSAGGGEGGGGRD